MYVYFSSFSSLSFSSFFLIVDLFLHDFWTRLCVQPFASSFAALSAWLTAYSCMLLAWMNFYTVSCVLLSSFEHYRFPPHPLQLSDLRRSWASSYPTSPACHHCPPQHITRLTQQCKCNSCCQSGGRHASLQLYHLCFSFFTLAFRPGLFLNLTYISTSVPLFQAYLLLLLLLLLFVLWQLFENSL